MCVCVYKCPCVCAVVILPSGSLLRPVCRTDRRTVGGKQGDKEIGLPSRQELGQA